MTAKANDTFRIQGGYPISGKVRLQGNKNEALPALAASILTDEEVILDNVPPIQDVLCMQEILRCMGTQMELEKEHISMRVRLQTKNGLASKLPMDLSSQLRGSVTLAGPLLARNGEVFLPRPGGDRIGRRRLDTHFLALKALGAKVKLFTDGFELSCPQLRGADILLDEASVTATENVVSAASLAEGNTVIYNAASEPHVQGLCRLLNAMGAKITGIGSNRLHIEGVKKLHGTRFRIAADYLEAGSFIALAAITGGELRLEKVDMANLASINMAFLRLGIQTHVDGEDLIVPSRQSLVISDDLGGTVPHIGSAPWPGFPADMTSVALVCATQCKGTVLIHEKMFESRLFFTDRLIAMGAKIVLCDPHRAVVLGPSKLVATSLTSPDIRAGMALLIAALCAKGESHIQNVIQIDRGFANIGERLRDLGAHIIRE